MYILYFYKLFGCGLKCPVYIFLYFYVDFMFKQFYKIQYYFNCILYYIYTIWCHSENNLNKNRVCCTENSFCCLSKQTYKKQRSSSANKQPTLISPWVYFTWLYSSRVLARLLTQCYSTICLPVPTWPVNTL